MDQSSSCERFLKRLNEGPELEPADRARLEQRLRDVVASARRVWPDVALANDEFLDHLAERVTATSSAAGNSEGPVDVDGLLAALDELKTDDLYLACACLHAQPRALAGFERRHGREIDVVLGRMNLSGTDAGDIKVAIHDKLFGPRSDARPGIAGYSGRGGLHSWLRVVATRTALNHLRTPRRETPFDEAMWTRMAADSDDPELALLKQTYREELETAFRQAVGSLSGRQKALLGQYHLDDLSFDKIALQYRVHRTTVGRWLASAEKTLMSRVRRTLMERLNVQNSEIDSIVRLVRSQVELSPGWLVGSPDAGPDAIDEHDSESDCSG